MRGVVGRHTLIGDLSQATLDLDLSHESLEGGLVVAQVPQLLLELDGEGDDVCACAAVGLDPFCDLGEVFAFLAEVVFHG
jgi:hypothetical protein